MRRQYPCEEDRFTDKLFSPDCDLTNKGVEQSRQAGCEFINQLLQQSTGNGTNRCTQIHFVVSPLRRALQTAQNMIWGIQKDMVSQQVEDTKKSEESMYTSWQPDTLIVQPLAAEIMMDSCDIGTPLMDLDSSLSATMIKRCPSSVR